MENKKNITMPPSTLEILMANHIRAVGLPEPVTEFRFHPVRKWRFDFAWPEKMLAIEVNGGTWNAGRHARGKGLSNDAEKGAVAQIMGWMVLSVTSDMVRSGEAIKYVLEAYGKKSDNGALKSCQD
jgi:very-short-patch-repair endonuclease